MKGALGLLIGCAIFAGLVAVFFIPSLVAEDHFGLRQPEPMLVGIASLSLTLFALYRWLLWLQRKELMALSTTRHPVFGEVRKFKDHWTASIPVTDGGLGIDIWGESLKPAAVQVSTFAAIRERYPQLLAEALENARVFLSSSAISLSTDDLHLEGIYLSATAVGSFALTFDVPSQEQKIPWGLTAEFVDFAVDAISDNH